MSKDDSPNQACNEMIKFLVPLSEGTLVPDFTNKLHEVVQGVRETGKQGSISISLKIALMKGSQRQVEVNADLKANVPEFPRPMSIYFTDDNGGLHRSDPRQMGLKFEEETSKEK